ncbi:aryl-alcohol dehydrogenase-like predicted oxidoreductase [Pseudonocardia hierapolitana]|uniref:Aryl-alcohol dehydrogenase-like predicted oxidoreductase n=1 Tax=Pseudonocardia hierapolitana TaxID=1128676 RepID=A0A561SHB4_9PSEU|nr:aldo/keto reductase [Pseudonocardia hierapolitana]TWF74256.1 aryl-alcohol dehydrogenase-like predicted oxidoreductase [Pseudonocardia hierapolitana]
MEYTRLGSTGLQVSRICLGMMSYGTPSWREWVLDVDASRPLVRSAVEAGITFFDTADGYSLGVGEEVTGTLLREFFARRDDYVLATKVFFPMSDRPNDRGLSRKHIMASIDGSLRRLGTDHVDLYQIHRWDPETPIEETMEALHDVVRAGKARYIGASSMFAWQFAKAQATADLGGWTRFVSMQDHYNLIYREEEREMHPLCLDQGVGVIPWSPLARGRLARLPEERTTTRSGSDPIADNMYTESDDAVVRAVAEVAKGRDLPLAQVALAWMLHKEAITAPIVGATKPGHIEDAVAAVGVELSDDEIAALEAPYVPHPVLGHQ